MTNVHRLATICLATFALCLPSSPSRADKDEVKGGPKEFKNIKYRSIGPAAGGRVSRACGVPGNPLVYYAATASGGVWKSADGGLSWKPIFDDQPTSSIGAIAVAPSDANVVYVGAGEANIRGNVAAGNGIYKSTDGGKTWKHVWKQTGQIGQMIVHPRSAEIAFAAVLGHAFGPNPERGVYRTTDGGKTWKQVLGKNPDTGAIDVCFDPSNPNVLFAALWQARRRPWEMTSGGPGSGLYTSTDGGDTWKQLQGKGLPKGDWGRIGVAVAPSDGRRIYALIEAEKGGLYRSDDGGKSWELVNGGHYLRQRPWYFSTVHVDPQNPDVVWCPNVRLLRSIDGGKTFKQVKGPHHVDHHDLWIDPHNPRRLIDSNDGGVDISGNGGDTWSAPMLPVSQFYHIAVDTRTPYHVCGTMQDIGTGAGPTNSLSSGGIALADWYGVGGGETGFAVPDPSDFNLVYAGEYGGYLSRFDYRTRQARNISIYPFNPSGYAAEKLKFRFQWTAPILVSPHDARVVYHGANVLFRTTDRGNSWQIVSPDLTRDDKSKQQWSGGPISGDNTGAEVYCSLFALAESPRRQGLLWAGSDDGLIHVSRDDGKSWTNVTKNIPGIPEWGTVRCIEASPFDEAVAYVVVDAHRLDDPRPYLFKTSDYGQTWKSLAGGLAQDVYLHVVRADPKKEGLLYCGTETGVVFSLDDGATWQELKLNLPTVAVHDLVVKDNDLVVGTHGRSIWILDDLTPVRAFRSGRAADVHLYPVQPAVRWRYHSPIYATEDKAAGDNPPRGAILHYFLKAKAKQITLDILDPQGKTVRTLTHKKKEKETDEAEEEDAPDAPYEPLKPTVLPRSPGVHRVVWDLCYEGAAVIKGAKLDAGEPRRGPLVNAGTYTLKLNAGGKTLTTTVEVLPDPRMKLPPGELEEQLKITFKIRDNLNRLVDIVNRLRSLKKQLETRNELLKDVPEARGLVKQSKELLTKLEALEEKLHNPKAEVVYDILAQKGGAKLYSQLSPLFSVVKESDGAPPQGVREVYAELVRELNLLDEEWQTLLHGDVARLNETARTLDVPGVFVPPPARQSKE